MRDRGSIAGFLISKLAVLIVVVLLICSIFGAYRGIDRSVERRRANKVIQTLIRNLRQVDSLSGRVRVERKLPQLNDRYKLTLSGTYENCQIVKIEASTHEEFRSVIFLNNRIENGTFRIKRENPEGVIIKKSGRISLDVF